MLERHHIFGGSNRKKADRLGLVVDLCHSCHNEPPHGVHHNKEAMLALKQYGQKLAMYQNNWTKQDFIREFGKSYIEED